jgi:hypothetical protein
MPAEYVFMIGFDEPGRDRGLGIAITTKVHTLEAAEFDRDSNGVIRWAVRREGDGTLPPTMVGAAKPPSDPALRSKLISESMFRPNHWDTLRPTSEGYPDVDTYMTRQFYIETKPAAIEQTDIFASGEDGYHTYRIPAMEVTKRGTVLAFCEGRNLGRSGSPRMRRGTHLRWDADFMENTSDDRTSLNALRFNWRSHDSHEDSAACHDHIRASGGYSSGGARAGFRGQTAG